MFVEQFFLSFYGKNVGAHFCEHDSLVSAAGADFEYFIVLFYFEELGLIGDGVGLRDGLSFCDGKGAVFIGYFVESGVEEVVAGDVVDSF